MGECVYMSKLLTALAILFLSISVYAQLDSLFLNSFFPGSMEETNRTVETISQISDPLCMLGFMQYCSYENKTVVDVKINSTVYYPFESKSIEKDEQGWKYDSDDIYTILSYNLTNLLSCGKNASSIKDIYKCTQEFNNYSGGTCLTSTSAFKLAFLNSPLPKENGSYELFKVFVYDNETYNAHRYITLRNGNGYYILDPFWCHGDDIDKCVYSHTLLFYNDNESPNYRGIVYKTSKIYPRNS